jgi:hypothetical protein
MMFSRRGMARHTDFVRFILDCLIGILHFDLLLRQ